MINPCVVLPPRSSVDAPLAATFGRSQRLGLDPAATRCKSPAATRCRLRQARLVPPRHAVESDRC